MSGQWDGQRKEVTSKCIRDLSVFVSEGKERLENETQGGKDNSVGKRQDPRARQRENSQGPKCSACGWCLSVCATLCVVEKIYMN